MKINELVPAINEAGFQVSVYDKHEIEHKTGIKNEHTSLLVVTSPEMLAAKAELAYGITKTPSEIKVGHYNKHSGRSEFGLVYTLSYRYEELMCIAVSHHVIRTSQMLINFAKNNKAASKEEKND
jgi:hypothetical protein